MTRATDITCKATPERVDLAAWAVKTVNDMVAQGIIDDTVEARSRHLNALLNVLLSSGDNA